MLLLHRAGNGADPVRRPGGAASGVGEAAAAKGSRWGVPGAPGRKWSTAQMGRDAVASHKKEGEGATA